MEREQASRVQKSQQGLDLLDRFHYEEDEQAIRERRARRLELLWTRRGFLARTAALGLILATAVAFLLPKRFTSAARLMPPDQNLMSSAMLAALARQAGGSIGWMGGQLLGLKTTGDLFVGILQSRTVEDGLVTKFDLQKLYHQRRWEDARKVLAERTDLSQDRKSELISISVTDRDPQRAQQMVQEYIEELNKVVINLNTSSAHRERVFLQARLDQVQQSLESAEKNFSQFASKHTAINIEAQGRVMIAAGAELEGQLIAAQTQLEGLRQIYSDNNVRVRAAEARVNELSRQLRKLGGQAAPPAADTQQDAGSIYPSIRQLPVLGVPYADLYRQIRVQEAVYETLTREYELAKVEEAKETPSVKVLDPPDVPGKKSFPPRLLIMFLGMVVALASGVAWALAYQAWETADPADVRKILAARIWTDLRASIPWANRRNGFHPPEGPAAAAKGCEADPPQEVGLAASAGAGETVELRK